MTPDIKVSVDGKPVSDGFYSRLISVSVSDKEGTRSDTVQIKLDDANPFSEIPRRGAKLTVAMGYKEAGGAQSLGDFVVDEVEIECLPYAINITGKSADMRETLKEGKNRHWDDKSVKDIVSEIAKDNGLEPAISGDVASHAYKWFGQVDESDMSVVDRLAQRHGALFTIKEGRLIFAEKGAGLTASGQGAGSAVIRPEIIVRGSCKVSIADRDSYGKVVAYHQDKDKAEREEIEVEVENAVGEAVYRLREAFSSPEEAEKAAKAKGEQLRRGGLNTNVTVVGDPALRAGGLMVYQGVRPGADGIPFVIETAEHSFSKDQGYRTSLSGKVKKGEGEGSAEGSSKNNGTVREKADAEAAAAEARRTTFNPNLNRFTGDGPD